MTDAPAPAASTPVSTPAPAVPPAQHSLSHIEGQVVKYATEAYGWGETEVKALLAKIAYLIHPKRDPGPQPTAQPTASTASPK